MIHQSKNININHIKYKKIYHYTNSFHKTLIRYKKEELICQTPKLFIPFDLVYQDNKCYIYLSLSNKNVEPDINQLYMKIKELEMNISKKFDKKNIKNFYSSIRESDNGITLKARIPIYNNIPLIEVYNQHKDKIDIEKIKSKLYCETIVHFESVWFYEDKFGLTINLIQIKLELPLTIKEYAFHDTYSEHPKYKKYFKMLKMGIPKDAVKQKMILCNLDPEVLDGKKIIETPKKSSEKNNCMFDINILKKTSHKKKLVKKENTPLHSLSEINKIRNTLRRINKCI